VRQATKERKIDYPVAVDNDYEVWSAFANRYWPALYFVDADGVIRDQHFGEGRYERSERVIQRLLRVDRELVSVEGVGVEAAADWDHLRTPETYLGYERGEHPNNWDLSGEWTVGPEDVVLDQAGGSIAYRFDARDAHLVLSPGAREPIPFRVLVDGEAPGASHGVDVDDEGYGLLRDGRLYQLVREQRAVRERTLEITFLEPGAEAYSFTFG
jgi:thioredoxin family protein